MDILMLNETEVQRLLDPDALLDALAESFRALSSGLVDAPKRIGVSVPNTGFLLAMPAYQQSQAITVKLVSVFHGNKQLGIPPCGQLGRLPSRPGCWPAQIPTCWR